MHRHRPGTFGLTTSAVLASMVITGFADAKTHEVRIDPVAGTMTPSSLEISEGDVIRFVEEPNDDAIFADDFSSDLGWTSSATSLTGLWIRRIPYGECSGIRRQVDASADLDDWCMMTGGSWGVCTDDVDLGNVILESPTIVLPESPVWISFAQWFANNGGLNPLQNPMIVEAIIDGTSYELSRVETDSKEVSGGWKRRVFALEDFASWSAGAEMRLRFTCDEVINAVVEGGVDDVEVRTSPPSLATIRTATGCEPNDLFSVEVSSDVGFATWFVDDLQGLSEFDIQYDGGCKSAVSVTVVERTPLLVGEGGYASIQAAIDAASDGDVIQVVGGTRTERVHLRDRKVVLEPVPGTGEVTLQGDGTPGSLMWIGEGQGPETVVRGFRFVDGIAGNPDPDGVPNNWASGGGGLTLWGTSPLIEQCEFVGNEGQYGPAINLQGGNATIRNCTFTGNTTTGTTAASYPVYCGGAIKILSYRDDSPTGADVTTPVIEDCVFTENEALLNGGAVSVWYSAPIIRNCMFEANRALGSGAGAIVYTAFTDFTTPDDPFVGWKYIEGCTFVGNRADAPVVPGGAIEGAGGAFVSFQDANNSNEPTLGIRFFDCVFEQNISTFNGGALWIQDTRLEFDNVQVNTNDSDGYPGGGVYASPNTSVVARRSEICGNSPDDFGGSGDLVADGYTTVCSEDICPGDITGDCVVNGADLGLLISGWGVCAPICPGDLNLDGVVSGADLGIMISFWTF